MNILVVGGGGREHAIATTLSKSPLTTRLSVAPGNPGIETFAECYPIAADDILGQCKLANDIKADIVFIGPEIPLVLGLKDELSKLGISAFGPSKKHSFFDHVFKLRLKNTCFLITSACQCSKTRSF